MTSSGSGNLSHLSGELFKMMTGLDLVHVPYKGTVPALTGLAAGEVHVMFDAMPSALPHVQSGRLRALAVTSAGRVEALPDVPTVGDFVQGYEVTGMLGVGAPRNTPAEIVDRLNKEINAVLADPAVKARLVGFGTSGVAGTPADFGRYYRRRNGKMGQGDQVRRHQAAVSRAMALRSRKGAHASNLPIRSRRMGTCQGRS